MIAVAGAGSWGTALTIHLARTGAPVRLWALETEIVDGIRARRRNPIYMPDFDLPAGVEAGGALKNVVALATGLSDGLGLGENARAALITRGLAEMTRLAVALGGEPATLAGLAGMGDLVLTATGTLSRNRSLGMALAR